MLICKPCEIFWNFVLIPKIVFYFCTHSNKSDTDMYISFYENIDQLKILEKYKSIKEVINQLSFYNNAALYVNVTSV